MNMNKEHLKKTAVFRGMTDEELDAALSALRASVKEYEKDQVILHAGTPTDIMGLVLEGSVRIESNDMWGNRSIFSHVEKGQVFAETYALVPDEALLVDAVANQDCRILMLRIGFLSEEKQDTALWRLKLMSNMLSVSVRKNLVLSGRSFHTSPKTIRGRVMAYLSSMSLQKESDEFDIPFDRQQLADYLNVDRTALSKELGRMRKEGLIDARKNHFRLRREKGYPL